MDLVTGPEEHHLVKVGYVCFCCNFALLFIPEVRVETDIGPVRRVCPSPSVTVRISLPSSPPVSAPLYVIVCHRQYVIFKNVKTYSLTWLQEGCLDWLLFAVFNAPDILVVWLINIYGWVSSATVDETKQNPILN